MRFSDDDGDIDVVFLTVTVTIALGAMVYAYKSSSVLQTAEIPAIERTIPTIVPSQPRL